MYPLRQTRQLFSDALLANAPLRWALGWQVILLAAGLLAMPFDRRLILGLNPWIKPMKFEISVIVYLLTVALLLYGLRWHRSETDAAGWKRSRHWLSLGFALAMTVENTVIALQAGRGVRSHMNYTSVWNGLLFSLMGFFIVVNTVLLAGLLGLWCVAQVRTPKPVTAGIRIGLLLMLAGSLEGLLMVLAGGHTVGAKDGLAGLPFLNWSTTNGDLRVAHFFALHALEVLPLAGILLARTRIPIRLQVAGVWIFSVLYTGGVCWLFAEARNGKPFLAYLR